MNPYFSIIIPCYNCAGLMQRGLRSLETQTSTDFEVVFVDDCSTDATYTFLQDFCQQTSLNTHLVRTEKNGGPGKAREMGISVATGKYITFMDSDDWYESNFMESINKCIMEDDYDMIFFDYYRNYGSGKRKHICCTRSLSHVSGMSEYVAMAFESLWGLVVKSGIIKKISMPALYNSEDAAVVPVLVSLSQKITFIPIPLYNYLYREQSLSTSRNKQIYQGFIDAFQFVYENISSEFVEAKEFRGIHLVLYGAVFKAIDAGLSREKIQSIVCGFERKFPQWQANKYVKLLPLRKRFFLFLVRKRFLTALYIYVTAQRLLLRFL